MTKKMRMTKQEEQRVEAAEQAKAGLTDEEREAEVKEVAGKVAEDVDAAKPESKPKNKKKDVRPKHTTTRRTPGQEALHGPAKDKHDPLQGVTVDPNANYTKIVNVLVTIGDDDERSLDEFIADIRDALVSQAHAKLATVLVAKVAIDGKHILSHHYEAEVARLRGDSA